MNLQTIINDSDLDVGQTKRMNCPICKGSKTFTITNVMGKIMWNCYKASCNVSGSKNVTMSADTIKKAMNQKNVIDYDTFEMPSNIVFGGVRQEVKAFAYEHGIAEHYLKLPLYYDVKEKRIVFPIKKDYQIVDAVGRATSMFRFTKWKRYGKSDVPFNYGSGDVAVIVEDCLSATVIGSDKVVGVALLGTSLQESHKDYLKQFSTIVVALDPDALPFTDEKTFELLSRCDLEGIFQLESSGMRQIVKDLRPSSLEDISSILAFLLLNFLQSQLYSLSFI